MIAIDSHGWIERFTNGPKAPRYNDVIDKTDTKEIVTPTIIIYEVYKKVKAVKGEQMALESVTALNQTYLVTLDVTIALEAADLSLEHKLHMADAIIYATARHFNAELYTGNVHLRGMKNVKFI